MTPLTFSQRASIQVPSDLNALSDVLSWFDQFHNSGLPQAVWLQCQLALVEGFTNAVRHAHQGQSPDVPIDLEIQIYNRTVELRIWDRGPGFDFDDYLAHFPGFADKSAEGGRGLGLMKQISDHISYTRTDDRRNCLLIVKRYAEHE